MDLQSGMPKLPVRCRACGGYAVYPVETRLSAVLLWVGTAAAMVALIRVLAPDDASSPLGVAGLAAVLVTGLLVGAWLVGRSTRRTGTRLVKSRGPLGFR